MIAAGRITNSHRPVGASRIGLAAVVLLASSTILALFSAPVARAAVNLPAANPPAAETHGLGLLPTRGLPEGVSPALAGLVADAAALPASVDLSAWAPPVGNQGTLNSCASWVTGYYYRYWLRNHLTGETSTFAPMFLYSQLSHGADSGSSIGDNVALLQSQGIPHEADYAQGPLDYRTQPTPAEVQAAAPYRATSGSYLMFDTGVGTEAQLAIEASLAAGRPVILTFPLYSNFIGANSSNYFVDVPSADTTPHGYHGGFVARYDAQGVWLENSWGTGWGQAGWAELSWAFVNQYAAEGWTMSAQENGALVLSALASPFLPGAAQSVTVTAKSANGATNTGYRGTVHFTSSDPAAVLPADYAYTAADAGVKTFSVTFNTAGTQSVTATDQAVGSITGRQTGVVQASGSVYHALAPARVLDSRPTGGVITNMGLTGKFTVGLVRTFAVAGARYVGGGTNVAVPNGATAITGNLTMVGATAGGIVALGPTESAGGDVTTVTFAAGDIRATGVTMGLGPSGTLQAVFRSASAGASVNLILDVTGYFTPDSTGATYHSVTPGRVLDTRPTSSAITNIGLSGKFASGVVRDFSVAGVRALGWTSALVPAGATAVTGNLTVTNATSLGYVALGPTMTSTPSTSTLNVTAGINRANGVTITLSPAGTLAAVWVGYYAGSSVDVIFDVTGYFTNDASGLSYHPLTPVRLLDSATNRGLAGAFASAQPRTLTVGGVGEIPSDAAGISGDIAVVGPSSLGFAFVSPEPVAAPASSSVNSNSGVSCANGLNVPIASSHVALVWMGAAGSAAHLQLDVTGYWK